MLLLLLGLLCLLEAGSGLPAQSGSLKRKKKKKGSSVELRLLNESQAGSGSSASGPDYLYLALRRYLNNQELTEWLQSYEKRCKSIARLTKIGTSAQDRCGTVGGTAWQAAGGGCRGRAQQVVPASYASAVQLLLLPKHHGQFIPSAIYCCVGCCCPAGRCGP